MVVPGIEADEDDVVVVILPTPGFSPRSSEDVTHGHGYARVAAPDGGSTRARRYISPGGYARYHARAVASVSSRIRSDASSRESSDARFPECAMGALTGASAAFSISFSRAYSRACSLSSSPVFPLLLPLLLPLLRGGPRSELDERLVEFRRFFDSDA